MHTGASGDHTWWGRGDGNWVGAYCDCPWAQELEGVGGQLTWAEGLGAPGVPVSEG